MDYINCKNYRLAQEADTVATYFKAILGLFQMASMIELSV